MILLDTSVLIELFRIKSKEKSFFYRITANENSFGISVITHYEVLVGSNHSQGEFWKELFETISILPFDLQCSVAAINIYKDLKSKNKLIELADLAVGATAISNNLPLATLNKKHFERIKDLKIIEPG